MEDHVKKLLEEENRDLNKLKEERLLKVQSAEKEEKNKRNRKDMLELLEEEERLNAHLDKLRRENFELQVSINSYQVALAKKLTEFEEAETELNDLYQEIWSEREKFCKRADEFDGECGVLSDWWKTEKKSVEDLEKFGGGHDEGNDETKTAENDSQDDGPDIERLPAETMTPEAVYLTGSGEPLPERVATVEKKPQDRDDTDLKSKKVRFACVEPPDEENKSLECEATKMGDGPSGNELFSLMDLNKMKMLKANRNRLARNKL